MEEAALLEPGLDAYAAYTRAKVAAARASPEEAQAALGAALRRVREVGAKAHVALADLLGYAARDLAGMLERLENSGLPAGGPAEGLPEGGEEAAPSEPPEPPEQAAGSDAPPRPAGRGYSLLKGAAMGHVFSGQPVTPISQNLPSVQPAAPSESDDEEGAAARTSANRISRDTRVQLGAVCDNEVAGIRLDTTLKLAEANERYARAAQYLRSVQSFFAGYALTRFEEPERAEMAARAAEAEERAQRLEEFVAQRAKRYKTG